VEVRHGEGVGTQKLEANLLDLITMDVSFCIAALEDALARHDKPEIFNTDQGSQFTSAAFTCVLADRGITINMDGKGAWRDNVFVERRPHCTLV
jgi:transposase InsO family protein